MLHDTAGFIHLVLVRDQLVRPMLDPEAFKAARARGAGRDVPSHPCGARTLTDLSESRPAPRAGARR